MIVDTLTSSSDVLNNYISRDKKKKKQSLVAVRYYASEHDIMQSKIYIINDQGQAVEDTYATNTRISHPFFTELVDQVVSYILSKPVEVKTKDKEFQKRLDEYWNEDAQLFLQKMLQGASIKASEYAFVRTDSENRIRFQVSDSVKTFEVLDEFGEIGAIIRYYTSPMIVDDKIKDVDMCEVWDSEQVFYFVRNDGNDWVLNRDVAVNPRPHVVASYQDDDGEEILLPRAYGEIPFFKLLNNDNLKSDLDPIKNIIDDYDIMSCHLSNNLQDFSEALYVVKGYEGENQQTLKQALKDKKMVRVGNDGTNQGDVDIKTFNIPVEGRKTKMELDQSAIYKFGMGFDAALIANSSGNVTNVQIAAGYSLLDMKAAKKEKHLRTLIRWMNRWIVKNINELYGTNYDDKDIEVIITKETTVNKKELVNIEKIKQEIKDSRTTNLLNMIDLLDEETIIETLADILEIDVNTLRKRIPTVNKESVEAVIDTDDSASSPEN